MFIDLLSESCEEGEEFLYSVTKMSQYLEDKFVQISLTFWLLFELFQLRQTHRIKNASFFTGHMWEVYARKLLYVYVSVAKKEYTYLQNKRMRRCGVPPPTNNFRKT